MVNIQNKLYTETLAFETELYQKHIRYLHGSKSGKEKTLAALDRHQLFFHVFLNLVFVLFFVFFVWFSLWFLFLVGPYSHFQL